MKPKYLKLLLNIYPPYLGAGIFVQHISDDYREVIVSMKLRWYNRNYVGTHFGGSLASMTDPFFMLMLMNILGKEYVVWDQAARIKFIRPGRGRVVARFHLNQAQIDEIHVQTQSSAVFRPEYEVEIVDEEGQVVAQVVKEEYIRKKA
ncbi:MAG: DUF4442 domain-containing protein [Anaerolineae bacterium]|jgi:acyl-coenzyme A thioesterase PaaI-like protein|nr:DUF4442 domain-containing protein [Anaerolineae bacterium]MBT7191339.1 DUF4442 domain-containing protein [Anaerolineae bacterium]MBT7992217.1 DUF4442 domain-containing protein [Anaerolineae bacterium]